jgi:hypothetical protein
MTEPLVSQTGEPLRPYVSGTHSGYGFVVQGTTAGGFGLYPPPATPRLIIPYTRTEKPRAKDKPKAKDLPGWLIGTGGQGQTRPKGCQPSGRGPRYVLGVGRKRVLPTLGELIDRYGMPHDDS